MLKRCASLYEIFQIYEYLFEKLLYCQFKIYTTSLLQVPSF